MLMRAPRQSLTSLLIEALTERIQSGIYAKGDQLPTEKDLIEEFNVSRTVVREAIANLKASGLVATRQGKGAFVLDEGVRSFSIPDDKLALASDLLEALEVRIAIESEAAALAAQAGIEGRMLFETPELPKAKLTALVKQGNEVLKDEAKCAGCHKFGDVGDLGMAPDLTGYGSREWLRELIADPTHEKFYSGQNDRMPSFAKDRSNPKNNQLSPQELELLVSWLRGEWYRREE